MGDAETWDAAEAALQGALDAAGVAWELNAGDGAFYGPKIDLAVRDAHGYRDCLNQGERGGKEGREWVCVPLETVDEDLDKDASVAGDLVVDVRVNSTHLSFESQVLVSTWSKPDSKH